MGYADQFESPDLLDSISWISLPETTVVAKLAANFIKREHVIKRKHRNWKGPNTSNLRPFVLSYYKPSRGLKRIIDATLKEIGRQKEIRRKRRDNLPYKFGGGGRKMRRNVVARARYAVIDREQMDPERRVQDYRCTGVGCVNDTLFMVDEGRRYYNRLSRVYMRHKPTGAEKVVVLKTSTIKSVTGALLEMAPKSARRAALGGGIPITFDFENDCFEIDGKHHPWKSVARIYTGKEIFETDKNPEKYDDD